MVDLIKSLPVNIILPILIFICCALIAFFFFVMQKVWDSLTGDKKALKKELHDLNINVINIIAEIKTLNAFLESLRQENADLRADQRRTKEDLDYAHRKIRGMQNGETV